MVERPVLYPHALGTRVSESVFSLIEAEAVKRRESSSATVRRILESWATFQIQQPRNSGNASEKAGEEQ